MRSARARARVSLSRIILVAIAAATGCGGNGAGASASNRPTILATDGGASGGPDASTIPVLADDDAGETTPDADPPAPPPDVLPGDPISAPDGVWTNVPFPAGYCRDGTQAHLMVHLNSASQKVAIYEEGGGACFNDTTCTALNVNLPSYVLGQGIFDFANPENPIRDWNVFYVPYCTGDVHAGDNLAGNPGPLTGKNHYSGYTNLKLYLARILATVPHATDVLLTGSSAGGFGAGLTADLVARNVPASVERVTLLDDSGPPMSTKYIPTCLQSQWSTVWGFGNSVLKDCGSGCPDPSNFIGPWMQFLIGKYATGKNAKKFMGGLISATGDGVISTFFGFGANNCTAAAPVALTSTQFEAGLFEVRSQVQATTDRFGTFYYDATAHTTLIQNSGSGVLGGLYDTQVNGVKLTEWIRDLLEHKQAAHVGP